jgi:hypothetical protein
VENDARSALEALQSFLNSEDKLVVVDGTHQNRKHVLALATALAIKGRTLRILFRANGRQNAGDFLRPLGIQRLPSPGDFLRLDGHRLFVDTINPRTWNASPSVIDIAVVYPLDSLAADTGSRCIEDLEYRRAGKILLVTWADIFDVTWLQDRRPVWVTYDAEQDDLAYHARVKVFTGDVRAPRLKTPDYASRADPRYLIRLHCDRCRCGRWALLNKAYPGIAAINDAETGEYEAKCLVCGSTMVDNYNWYGQD